jgi:putative membrane protein
MHSAADIATGLVAAIHAYILVLEMFLWDTPRGRRVFGTTPEFAAASKVLAANQGLYNGFLAAGVVWAMWLGPSGEPARLFFLDCIALAGIYGAATVNRRIFFVQTVPAVIAIALVLGTR